MLTHNDIHRRCLNLRSRLLTLPGFALYSELLLNETDPVASIRGLFALGIPLCHIFNLLPPRHYPRIKLDFSQSDEFTKRMALALFALRAHQTFGCQHFTATDVSSELTASFLKALNALTILLDKISAKAASGLEIEQPSPGPKDIANHSDVVRKLLKSEHTFIKKMETLESFSNALIAIGILDPETASLVFPKKLFTFARKFRIRLECVAQLPRREQDWGALFINHAMDITMNLRIYCVNIILIKPALTDLDVASLHLHGLRASSNAVETLLSVPLEHLELCRLSTATFSTHYRNLSEGVACLKRMMRTVVHVQKKATSDQICDSLKNRIADWRGLELSSLGLVVLEGSLLTRRNDILQNFEVFVFEKRLLLCDETLPPPPSSSSRIGRRKVSSASVPPTKGNSKMLYIKDHFEIREISSISTSEYERLQDNAPRVFFELALTTEFYILSLLFSRQQDMQKWHSELEDVRNAPNSAITSQFPSQVEEIASFPLPTEKEFVINKRTSRTYSGTLTDLESGPVPQSFLQLTSTNPRSAFVKFQFGGHVFVLSVVIPVQYDELMDRIDKKLRYSGFPGWNREGKIITYTAANGHLLHIGPETSLDSMFQEGTMVSLSIQ
ncbi:hypothetical protein D9757_008108 [Collybiopsis confluens]|uniref:Cdc24/Scd1 N-terminal domain-containing protein n=1 Tax=Collybiopsis confluens TaxID=2823264 RepID=A0A8H5H6W9_9AGAR|nr:hypothetical protein D9757_008108 [Collybiopsis confluens]